MSAYREVAFIGTITEMWTIPSIPKRGAVYEIHYAVERTISGPNRTHLTLGELGSGACTPVEGSRLEVGDRVVLTGSGVRHLGALRYLDHEIDLAGSRAGLLAFRERPVSPARRCTTCRTAPCHDHG